MNYDYLKPLQNELLDILLAFDKISKDLDINYFLIAGSLLGAYRHDGFIPWDDDIDIGMCRSDYNKLIEYFRGNDSLPYTLYCSELDKECHIIFAKFVDRRKERPEFSDQFEECDNLSIDIFPYDRCGKKDSIKVKTRFYKIRYLKFVVQSKDKLSNPDYHEASTKRILRVILSSFMIRKDYKSLLEKVNKLANTPNIGHGYYMLMCGKYGYGKEIIAETDLFPIGKVLFENVLLPVPHNSIDVLRTNYGENWNIIPPEHQREQHDRKGNRIDR